MSRHVIGGYAADLMGFLHGSCPGETALLRCRWHDHSGGVIGQLLARESTPAARTLVTKIAAALQQPHVVDVTPLNSIRPDGVPLFVMGDTLATALWYAPVDSVTPPIMLSADGREMLATDAPEALLRDPARKRAVWEALQHFRDHYLQRSIGDTA